MLLRNKINQIKKVNFLILSLMLFLKISHIWTLQKNENVLIKMIKILLFLQAYFMTL
jgi:hypothetical protein